MFKRSTFGSNSASIFASTKISGENKKSIEQKILEDRAIKRALKNEEVLTHKMNALSALCPLPKPNEEYLIVTEKQFNAFALIQHLCESNVIDEMYLAIYRINMPTVEKIIDLIEGGAIKRSRFVISSFFNQTKKTRIMGKAIKGVLYFT